MRASSVIKVAIGRPYDEVYQFLVDPRNLARWATSPGGGIRSRGDGTWLVEVPSGKIVMRFTPPNPWGVLDYRAQGGARGTDCIPVRLYPNGEGSELVMILMRRPEDSPERFDSDVTWVTSDLERLKTLLEAA